ncbi:disease resistance protein TAO1-like [Cryptomeria japonica]|uniref:disease resistance protein TAO1-like n=1 Tax=Cryptomeria japonica TaxID=3369 RepID=UPI0027DA8879|nr:disease resistance protein TAO1-like [Cryptomeria japonica]
MGRAMVADNYPGIGERRRSWRLEDAEVITKSLGTMSIQGFSISGEERSNIVLQEESFASMTNLQLLWIAGEVEKTDFLNLCPDLRWLRWKSSPLTCLPSEWSVEHLTVLDLSSGTRESPTKLRELWSERSLSKVEFLHNDITYTPVLLTIDDAILTFHKFFLDNYVKHATGNEEFENLSVLRLSSAQYLERLPDFSAFPALTVLDLEDCPNLTSIPDSIGILGGLKCLNLSWCRNLVKLPDGISKLSSLEKLSLSHCISLKELPSAMEELMALKELDIGFARHIQELPNFGKLLKLESLTLAGCLSISFLPDPIGELNNLKELDIQFLGLIQKLPSLRNLLSLKKLIISGCESLRNLPESLGELRCLQYLEMNKCSSIDCLPEKFRDLVHLEELYMNDCPRFLNFPSGFENLLNLRILEMRHNPSLMQLPSSISKLPSLVWFDASDCNLLDGLHEGIGDLLPLGILNLENNFFCQLPSSIFKLTNLTKLNLNNCHSLEELPTLPQGIVELDVGSCTQLIRLPCMSDLKRLTTLMLCNCEKLIELPELSSSQCLAVLNISKCINIRSLEGVEGLNSLKTFYSGGSGVSVSNLNQHIEVCGILYFLFKCLSF